MKAGRSAIYVMLLFVAVEAERDERRQHNELDVQASSARDPTNPLQGFKGLGVGLCRGTPGKWPAFINLRVKDLARCASICTEIGRLTNNKFVCQAIAHSDAELEYFPGFEDCVLYATPREADLVAGAEAIGKMDVTDKKGDTRKYKTTEYGPGGLLGEEILTASASVGDGFKYTCYKQVDPAEGVEVKWRDAL